MIYLDINKPKDVVVTLTENITIYSVTYSANLPANFTWEIEDADTNNKYLFTNTDTSPAPFYFNQFNFTVIPGATYGATAGIIPAKQGVYTYRVYQSKELDLSIGPVLLETGIMNIVGTPTAPITFTGSTNIITFKNI